MLPIHFAPTVYHTLGAEAAQELAALIRQWKIVLPDGKIETYAHYFFGRDKRNSDEAGNKGASYAWHAHLEPTIEPFKTKWEEAFDAGADPDTLVGGRIMSYSLNIDDCKHGFYLLNIHSDPEGHRYLFAGKSATLRVRYNGLAQDHQHKGIFPVPPVTL